MAMAKEVVRDIEGQLEAEAELTEKVSQADIEKMIKFLHTHTDYRVSKGHGQVQSTPKVKSELAPPRPPPPVPGRSSSFIHTAGMRGSHLLPILPCSRVFHTPRFSNFSGDEKGDLSFESWKLEVSCVLRDQRFTDASVAQGLRMALKGKARSLLLSLPEDCTAQQIVDKLEGVYGNVFSSEALLEKFYKETQQPNQSVAEYGMVLESIIQPAVQKGEISSEAKNSMLRSKFWSGISDPLLKNASRYKFDTITDFDELRKEIRAIELELANSSKTTKAQHQPIKTDSVKLDDILKKMDKMSKRLELLESKASAEKTQEPGMGSNSCKSYRESNQKRFSRGSGYRNRGRGRGSEQNKDKVQSQTTSGNLNMTGVSNAGQIGDLKFVKHGPISEDHRSKNKSKNVSNNESLLDRMVGKANEEYVYVNDVKCKSLLDSGSMVSTISETALQLLNPVPLVKTLDEFILSVKVAEGTSLPYTGYVEVSVKTRFLPKSIEVPLLVVPETDYNRFVPLVIGTNVLRYMKLLTTGETQVDLPYAWDMAFSALEACIVSTVKSTNKRPLKVNPMSVRTVSGICKSPTGIQSAVTESIEGSHNSIGICPRVVHLNSTGKCRIHVRVFNMTARVVYVKPKSILCGLNEVTVVRHADLANTEGEQAKKEEITSKGKAEKLGIDLSHTAENVKSKLEELILRWQSVQ